MKYAHVCVMLVAIGPEGAHGGISVATFRLQLLLHLLTIVHKNFRRYGPSGCRIVRYRDTDSQ